MSKTAVRNAQRNHNVEIHDYCMCVHVCVAMCVHVCGVAMCVCIKRLIMQLYNVI